MGRLADGTTLSRVQAEADAVSTALEREFPTSNQGKGLRLVPLQSALAEEYVPMLTVLMAAAVLILLVACANVAGLLMARGAARREEMAVRAVMGAGGGRLARQLLVENALLAGAAVVPGVLLALWVQRGVQAYLSFDTLGGLAGGFSARVLGFALATSASTVLLAGLAPALRVTRVDPVLDLRTGRRSTRSRGGLRFQHVMVVTQVALTSVLVVVTTLLVRSFIELRQVDLGFDPRSLLTAEIQLPRTYGPVECARFADELRARFETLPDITAVAVSSHLPVRDPGNTVGLQRRDETSGTEVNLSVSQRLVLPNYFKAMGIPVIAGRGVRQTDRADAEPVVILSRSTARRLFGEVDAIGRLVEAPDATGRFGPRRVVGVVGDVVLGNPAAGADTAIYYPYAQVTRLRLRIALRGSDDAPDPAGVRAALGELDASVPLDDVRTMDAVIGQALSDRRVTSTVVVLFGATALLLTSVGLYGVLAYQVSLRLPEIGIRMALGASTAGITWHVIRGGLTLVTLGVMAGGMLALASGSLLESLLYGVSWFDLPTYLALAVVLGMVGTLACALPARRAARVNPVIAMRTD